uniref:Uncharacterized protein n=1 Tax=Oryzias latipes TaxID=8090 RepID=A0A286P9W4_ORYLA|nr:hypothetical protein [Oryzias latipes]
MPAQDQEGVCKLVHVMANAALLREQKVLRAEESWNREFENALANYLPVREHHVAFLTHNMVVTMIGAVVARALEQATRSGAAKRLGDGADESELRGLTLDLLADRHYVRNIACHDCSKTSEVEDVAYSGIMAVNMTRALLEESFKRRCRLSGSPTGSKTDDSYKDHATMTAPMANIGFRHHYENNQHHPEHYTNSDKRMPGVYVVEAVVDGLACVFERVKPPHVKAWLGMFSKERFPHPQNKDLARMVLDALQEYITDADYTALEAFRASVFAITGESCPWARVSMTSCCDHRPLEGDRYSEKDLSTYFEDP